MSLQSKQKEWIWSYLLDETEVTLFGYSRSEFDKMTKIVIPYAEMQHMLNSILGYCGLDIEAEWVSIVTERVIESLPT